MLIILFVGILRIDKGLAPHWCLVKLRHSVHLIGHFMEIINEPN